MQLATDCVGSSEKRASVLEQRQSCLSITHKTEAEHGSRARKPSTEAGAAHIICHPELAKDLTAGQSALGHHSPFSELTAPPDEPSVPITRRLKRTSRSPREIPSTDSGQALRRLPMNLPLAGGRQSGVCHGAFVNATASWSAAVLCRLREPDRFSTHRKTWQQRRSSFGVSHSFRER